MPVNIPAGTKFEAIKPTTNVNRRSALVNANDPTFTIEDFAQTVGGGTFPITLNTIPKATALGSLVDSNLLEVTGISGTSIGGNYDAGVYFTYDGSTSLLIASGEIGNLNGYVHIGDVLGSSGPSWGMNIDVTSQIINFTMDNTSILFLNYSGGTYNFGGNTSKFGILSADLPQARLSVTSDLVINIGGIDYIKVDVGGITYKIELVP